MLHLVRANTPYTVIILFILTLALKLQALGAPAMPAVDAHHALFAQIVAILRPVLGGSKTAFTVLALLMTFGQALYLRFITIRHRLFAKPSYVPAFVYLVLSALHPALGAFSAPLLLNWLVLIGLDVVLGFARSAEQPRTIFNAGFVLGCAALFHFPALLLLLFLMAALMLLRASKPGEWVVAMLGYLMPGYFAAAVLYLLDSWAFVRRWPVLGLSLPLRQPGYLYLLATVGGCVLLTLLGIISLMRIIHKMPVSTRRNWGAVIAIAILTAVMCLSTPVSEHSAWTGILPGLALVASPPMAAEKRSRLAIFTFYFLIALVIFAQLALRW